MTYRYAAKDSVTSVVYPWTLAVLDFSGTGYPGPNAPVNVVLLSSDGGGSVPNLRGVYWVDPSFAGIATGSISSPFTSVASAISGTDGDVTFQLANGTYDEATLTMPPDRICFLEPVSRTGFPVQFTNKVVFNAKNDNAFGARNIQFNAGVGFRDADGGTGQVFAQFASCYLQNITNENAGTAAFTHHFNLSCVGEFLTSHDAANSDTSDMLILGPVAMKGIFDAERCQIAGDVVGASIMRLRSAAVTHSQTTAGSITAYETYFQSGITITQAAGATFSVDRLSKFYTTGITHAGGTGAYITLD